MNQFEKSQVLVLIILALLLLITHFLPSSLRPAYLYFIFNFLIISLGAEAGLLSAFSKPLQDKTQSSSHTERPQETVHVERDASNSEHNEKKLSVTKGEKVKKCASSSKPSLFFIGNEETEAEEAMDEKEGEAEEEEDEEEEGGAVNGQEELCAKAEAFIGNFYKQLKMQREESWKKIHEFYQKAF